MFPAALVTAIRARFDAGYPDTCSVWRNVGSVTARGGQIDDWRRVSSETPGRLTSASPSEDMQGQAMVAEVAFTWHCAHDVDIRAEDHIVTGGRTYDVVGTDSGRTDAAAQHVAIVLVAREDLHL